MITPVLETERLPLKSLRFHLISGTDGQWCLKRLGN